MSHECRCSTHTESPGPATGSLAGRTVAEVSQRPAAMEVLRRLGINHCCGAHQSLREAAAAAGVPLDDLLRALNEAMGRDAMIAATAPRDAGETSAPGGDLTIDVRGLEPPLPMVRVLERLEVLPAGARLEVIHDRRPMFLYPQLDRRGFAHETDEPAPGVVRIRIGKRPRIAR